MKYHFCTCFDNNYLIYGCALYDSLRRIVADFTLYIVCLDETVRENLATLGWPEAVLIPLSEIEADDPEYAATAATRSRVEYIFTLSPVMPLYLLRKYPEIDILAYLDSDLYFFASPEVLYQEMGDRSLLIFEHDFYREESFRARDAGRFNMAFQLYRNDPTGRACLNHWRRECLEWCFDRMEDGKFADQKYLEEWPEKFGAVIASNHSGGGLAPWNCGKHRFNLSGTAPEADGKPVIFYHYQGCKALEMNVLLAGSHLFLRYLSNPLADYFYGTYFRALQKNKKMLCAKLPRERLQTTYLFRRDRAEATAVRRHSILYHFLHRYFCKIPLLVRGDLTWRGRRVFPLIFRLFFYHVPAELTSQASAPPPESV